MLCVNCGGDRLVGSLELSHHQQAAELILTRLAVNLGAERAGGTLNDWISVARRAHPGVAHRVVVIITTTVVTGKYCVSTYRFCTFKKKFLHNFQQRHHERFLGLSFMHTFHSLL
ncbi:unnamed protein product [Rangifer tarandus platyrhynchus]|uniref:Uncharacterized protein n=1 Tax=Rangifer tarandus platyrhynchus TaxID=3082113 RepID=A0AC59YH18_RANTA